MGTGTAALYALSAGKGRRLGLFDRADAASATAQTTPMIPVIVVAEKVADGEATTARKLMSDLIAAYPELRGVFASNPMMAQGAAEAAAESKTNKTGDKINLVGFDWDDKVIKLLQDGTIAALVVQDPFRMGYEGVRTALSASKGEQVPAQIDIAAGLITKGNMNSARSQELLKPQVKR
jgi:ribose transport system substrate-binding protein